MMQSMVFAALTAALIYFPLIAGAHDDAGSVLHGNINGEGIAQRIFGRLAQPGASSSLVIPFTAGDTPVLSAEINGEERPLLFDTGTNTCLLNISSSWPAPLRMQWAEDNLRLAQLEGKRRQSASGTELLYASAPLVRLGGVSLRDVPWRLYKHTDQLEAEWAGAFAPVLFRRWLIEVNNSRQEIVLHDRSEWQPAPGAVMLPMLQLPRGLFVPLGLGSEQLWFHFDTGFSGGVGLVPAVLATHGRDVTIMQDASEDYLGWHAQFSYQKLIVHEITLPGYPGLEWADGGRQALQDVEGIAYRDAYSELAGYHIGGIAGSGLWQHFDYTLDYEGGRLYLWRRAAAGEPAPAD